MSDAPLEIELARSLFGPLSVDARRRLEDVVAEPSDSTWDAAHSIVLNPDVGMGLTLWQAVLRVDASFPPARPSTRLIWRCPFCEAHRTRRQLADPGAEQPCPTPACAQAGRQLKRQSERDGTWPRIPDRATLISALRYATH